MNEHVTRDRPPRLVLVYAGDLATTEDEHPKGVEPTTTLLDKLDTTVGDSLLIALRRAFTATYCQDTSLRGLEGIIREIRQGAVDGLRGMGPMLATLRLKPLGPGELPDDDSPKVHKLSLVRTRTLPKRIKVEGEAGMSLFLDVIRWASAEPLLVSLRQIASLTFGELITRKAYARAVWSIRQLAAGALAPLNEWLEAINLEPVAMPLRKYDDDEWEDDPEHPSCQE